MKLENKEVTEVIAVKYEGEKPTVSGRELHEVLEVKTPYQIWFPRMCEYGFVEDIDFCTKMFKSTGGRPSTDHELTIEMAKELCMIQRSEKGKQFRQYFIRVEKAWNSPEMTMKRALQFANENVERLMLEVTQKDKRIEEMKPKEIFADSVATSDTSILIGELAKILKQNGAAMGQKRLFEWLRTNGYLIKKAGSDYNLPTQRAMEMGLFEMDRKLVNCYNSNSVVVQDSSIGAFRDRNGRICFARNGSEDYRIFYRNFDYLGSGYFTVTAAELNAMVGVR